MACLTWSSRRNGWAERDASFLANMSSIYALFEVSGDLLRPVELDPLDRYDDDLITIQKYQGKTNEQFTKLLLNVTALGSAFGPQMLSRRLAVLDPLCGRGTTLNQALMYGYDAAGIDLDQRDFEAYTTFIKTWLKRKRIKHKATYDGPVRRDGKVAGRRLQVSMAASKAGTESGRDAAAGCRVRRHDQGGGVLQADDIRSSGD